MQRTGTGHQAGVVGYCTSLNYGAYAATIGLADLEMTLARPFRMCWEFNAWPVGDLHFQRARDGTGKIAEGRLTATLHRSGS